MSNRRSRHEKNPLKRQGDGGGQSEWDKATYNSISQVDEGMQTIFPISIYEIFPDPKQPRRLLPGWLRYDRSIEDVLDDWFQMAEDEAGRTIPLAELLTGEATMRSQDNDAHNAGHIEASFMKLVDLAATIRRDGGLINPVTIYRRGTVYQLETGERRWLAHHLLSFALVEERWQKISTREVTTPSIWRQAHENTARDDLNAISLARQLALLVMDIYQAQGVEFHPYEVFGHDRHFYAQVADGFEFPVAYGDRERIIAAMGKSNVSQVNQYRALLRLPDEVWESADAENTAEKPLREFLKTTRDETPLPATSVVIEQESESITPVRDHSSVQAQESDAQGVEGDPVEEAVENGLPAHIVNLLYWAYKRAASALSEDEKWFSADNVTRSVDRLNQLIDDGLLEGRRPILNRFSNAAFYRISAAGCQSIGQEALVDVYGNQLNHLPPGADQPALNDSLTRPVSGGEVHAGTGSNAGSPPRRVTKQLFDNADRIAITTAANLTDKRLDTADGLQDAITTLQRSITAQQQKLDMLLLRKRA